MFYANTASDIQVCRIMDAIASIPVGKTRVVFGQAVTRWNDEEVEVCTWGKSQISIESAAEWIGSML